MASHQRPHGQRRASTWCCSFSPPPASPDRKLPAVKSPAHSSNPNPNPSPSPNPNPNPRPFLSRRILSPGRVSPIDSDQIGPDLAAAAPVPVAAEEESSLLVSEEVGSDFRFELRGKDGRGFVVELMDRGVLCESSEFFRGLVESDAAAVEVDDVDLYKRAIELIVLDERDLVRSIVKNGVSRAIDLLEVMCTIKYERGINACLKYIEAAPWTENEEEKLKALCSKIKLKEPIVDDIILRLNQTAEFTSSEEGDLAVHLIKQISNSTNNTARKDMQSLVNGILSESSVYQKEHSRLNRDELYQVCNSCLSALKDLLRDEPSPDTRPLIERVSSQVENLTWLFEILINNNVAEEFVELWGDQVELVNLHSSFSPMVRYELSRVSVCVFIALGRGKLQCRGDVRVKVFNSWFGPILSDFGWLKRCPKGLDFRMFQDTLGKGLLTLPLVIQQRLFEEWFGWFAKGNDCPNLSASFQVWWRRSFVNSVRMQEF